MNLPISTNQVSERITQLEKIVDALASKISAKTQMSGIVSSRPVPFIESVEIPFVGGNYERIDGKIIIAPDATFLARAIHFTCRLATSDTETEESVLGSFYDYLDFYWEYQVTGSRRRRMNIPVPSQVVYDSEWKDGMFSFFVEDVFSPGSTVTVWITPIGQPYGEKEENGFLWVGFSGTYVVE
jgi:hypothetical protein